MKYSALTDKGLNREKNEDTFKVRPDLGLFIVSDGMGGEHAGDLASRLVADALPGIFSPIIETKDISSPLVQARFLEGLASLSSSLRERTRHKPGLDGMGATVVAAVVGRSEMIVVHMGDSRAYLLRGGTLSQLTRDHTIVQILLDTKEISTEEALTHPSKGTLTRYVGMDGNPLPEITYTNIRAGDKVLLCSDGLHGMLPADRIRAAMLSSEKPRQICSRLIAQANEAGGKDNITAIVLAFPAGGK